MVSRLSFRHATLRDQIAITVTFGFVCVAIISSLISFLYGWVQIRETFVRQGVNVTKSLAAQSFLALAFRSPENAQQAAQVSLTFAGVRRVELFGDDGSMILRLGALDVFFRQPNMDPRDYSYPGSDVVELEHDQFWIFMMRVSTAPTQDQLTAVSPAPQVIGYVRVYQDKSVMAESVRNLMVANLLALLIFAIVFHLVIGRLLNVVTSPLALLSKSMAQLDIAAEWKPVEQRGTKDIQEMTTTFNAMVEMLRERDREREKLMQSRRHLAAHMESVREEQNAVIARELHDSVGGSLTMLKLGLASLREDIPDDDPVSTRLSNLLKITKDAIRMSRRLTHTLRPTVLDNMGLDVAIRWHVAELQGVAHIKCSLDLGVEIPLRPECVIALFRMAQESLTNVVKHAAATEVALKTSVVNGMATIVIRDNGVGFLPENIDERHSFGLRGMRERAENLGGCVSVNSIIGVGTTVVIEVPVERRSRKRKTT